MIRLVLSSVVATGICDETVLLEAGLLIGSRGFEDDVNSPSKVVEHSTSVFLDARHHFYGAIVLELPAVRLRLQDCGQVMRTARRELESIRRWFEVTAFCDSSHLDADFVPSKNELNI